MRRAVLVAAAVLLGAPGLAHAQFVTSGDTLSEPAQQNVEDTKVTGRLYTSFGYYGESVDGGKGQDVSTDTLLWGDLRGRLQADHIQGGKWDALGDFRIRFTPDGDFVKYTDQNTARGYAGGNEYDLKELYLRRSGATTSFSLGRLILRDLDAMTVDGVRLGVRKSASFEFGAAAGMFPNPYSRSLATDYALPTADTRSIAGYPAAAGAWGGYRLAMAYGSFGVGAIFPRNSASNNVVQEKVRTFLTAQGYARASATVNLFHYGVFDVAGQAGAQLTNLQAGLTWRAVPQLELELAYSHMSTYAIETYLRDRLETVPAPAAANSPTNNLDVARMAADEGRVGATYTFMPQQADLFGQVRYRRRDAIVTLPADIQIDVSAGIRKKNAVRGWELGANGAYISGDRTKSFFGFVRGHRTFVDDRLDVDLDAGYIAYTDCPAQAGAMDLTCQGNSKGSTVRAGFLLVFRKSERWLFLSDFHLSFNRGTDAGMARPNFVEQSAMLRGQYSF